MTLSKVLTFGGTLPGMTIQDGLDFIERTRRQLDRYEDAIPHAEGTTIAPEDKERIRAKCDALEVEINALLGIR